MHYREYGRTGKLVSLLGFGTSRFRPDDYATDAGQEKIVSLFVKARELGVNFFDTWHVYGNGQCETLLGHAFKRMKAPFFVSIKSRKCSTNADDLRRNLDASLKRMGINKVHFYHMWRILDIEQFRQYTRKGGPYEGALKARDEGLLDHICFSAHCGGEEIAEIAESGYFEGTILSYNILNFKYRETGLEAARKNRLGVAIMNPLGGGIIAQNPSAFSFIAPAEALPSAALRFCAASPGVSVVLSGMRDEQELLHNVRALERVEDLPTERIGAIRAALVEEFNDLCNGCGYCRGCPARLEPYKIMLAYNNYLLHGDDPRFFFEGTTLWEPIPESPFLCMQCGECEKKCSQHLPIRNRIEELNNIIVQRARNLQDGLERCFGNREGIIIGVYAAGAYAQEMMQQYILAHGQPCFPLYFFDSNPQKIGRDIVLPGYPVHHPDSIVSLGVQRLIIASEDYFDEISLSLKKYADADLEVVRYTLEAQYRKLPRTDVQRSGKEPS